MFTDLKSHLCYLGNIFVDVFHQNLEIFENILLVGASCY